MAFGSPQFAQIFAQGVQMLTAAFDRGAQLQQQQAEMEANFTLRKQAMDAKNQELKSQEKYQQLEFQIKQQQLKKVEAEVELVKARNTSMPARQAMQAQLDALNVQLKQAELKDKNSLTDAERETIKKNKMDQEVLDKEMKQIQVADAQHKAEQLDARAADPNQYSRSFETVAELTRERQRLQDFLADPFKMHAAGKNLSVDQLKKDAAAIDDSIVKRTDFLGEKYSRTRHEATREVYTPPAQTALHSMSSGQVAAAQSATSQGPGSSPPPQAAYGQLVQDFTMSRDTGVKAAAGQQLLQRLLDAKKAGPAAIASEMTAIQATLPGTPEEQRALWSTIRQQLEALAPATSK